MRGTELDRAERACDLMVGIVIGCGMACAVLAVAALVWLAALLGS